MRRRVQDHIGEISLAMFHLDVAHTDNEGIPTIENLGLEAAITMALGYSNYPNQAVVVVYNDIRDMQRRIRIFQGGYAIKDTSRPREGKHADSVRETARQEANTRLGIVEAIEVVIETQDGPLLIAKFLLADDAWSVYGYAALAPHPEFPNKWRPGNIIERLVFYPVDDVDREEFFLGPAIEELTVSLGPNIAHENAG